MPILLLLLLQVQFLPYPQPPDHLDGAARDPGGPRHRLVALAHHPARPGRAAETAAVRLESGHDGGHVRERRRSRLLLDDRHVPRRVHRCPARRVAAVPRHRRQPARHLGLDSRRDLPPPYRSDDPATRHLPVGHTRLAGLRHSAGAEGRTSQARRHPQVRFPRAGPRSPRRGPRLLQPLEHRFRRGASRRRVAGPRATAGFVRSGARACSSPRSITPSCRTPISMQPICKAQNCGARRARAPRSPEPT